MSTRRASDGADLSRDAPSSITLPNRRTSAEGDSSSGDDVPLMPALLPKPFDAPAMGEFTVRRVGGHGASGDGRATVGPAVAVGDTSTDVTTAGPEGEGEGDPLLADAPRCGWKDMYRLTDGYVGGSCRVAVVVAAVLTVASCGV